MSFRDYLPDEFTWTLNDVYPRSEGSKPWQCNEGTSGLSGDILPQLCVYDTDTESFRQYSTVSLDQPSVRQYASENTDTSSLVRIQRLSIEQSSVRQYATDTTETSSVRQYATADADQASLRQYADSHRYQRSLIQWAASRNETPAQNLRNIFRRNRDSHENVPVAQEDTLLPWAPDLTDEEKLAKFVDIRRRELITMLTDHHYFSCTADHDTYKWKFTDSRDLDYKLRVLLRKIQHDDAVLNSSFAGTSEASLQKAHSELRGWEREIFSMLGYWAEKRKVHDWDNLDHSQGQGGSWADYGR